MTKSVKGINIGPSEGLFSLGWLLLLIGLWILTSPGLALAACGGVLVFTGLFNAWLEEYYAV